MDFDPEVIRVASQKLVGELELEVPIFSAIKKKGKKLYEYARADQKVEVPKRRMTFFGLETQEITSQSVKASIKCFKGGYIRSWGMELGRQLGTGAIVQELRRTWSEPYQIEQSIQLGDLESLSKEELLDLSQFSWFVPISRALPSWKALTVGGKDEKLMKNGQISHDLGRRLTFEQKQANRTQSHIGIKVLSASQGDLLSLLEAQPYKGLKIKRIFNLDRP